MLIPPSAARLRLSSQWLWGQYSPKEIKFDEFTNGCWKPHRVEVSEYALWLQARLFNDIQARWSNLPVTTEEKEETTEKKI